MKKPLAEFLLGGPGHDGYAYKADTYCVDCGQAIIEQLYASDYSKLESRDTDDSPQPIFFGESDCACHCADCGEYLYGARIHCDQCEMLSINGHACHETGCPNSRKTWVPERHEWVRFVECWQCGCEVEQGETCSCFEPIEEEN